MRLVPYAMLATAATPAVAQTPAGTAIVNMATISYLNASGEQRVASNPVTLVVAERLDLQLAGDPAPLAVSSGETAATLVTLTNTGNGPEAFAVTVDTGERAALVALAIDGDGDGRFDPARDALLAGGRTPMLAAGATLSLLAIARASAAPVAGDRLTLTARAVTASGPAGSEAPGAGEGGGDAVVGATGAVATVTRALVDAGTHAAAPTLVKTVTIVAPDGSTRPVSGAAATYVLAASFPTTVATARVDDAVPAGTRYRPGTLSLDGVALTDATGDDAGQADGTAVAVTLGAVDAGVTHVVRFTVTLP